MVSAIVFIVVPLFFAAAPKSVAQGDENRTVESSDNSCWGCRELSLARNADSQCERSRTMESDFIASIRTDEAGKKFVCLDSGTNGTQTVAREEDIANEQQLVYYHLCNDTCIQILLNGTLVVDEIMENLTLSDNLTDPRTMATNGTGLMNFEQCDSILTPLKFWGATIVIFANMIYIFPYMFVVIVYLVIPDIRHRAYDGAVISYNFSQVLTQLILIGMGASLLCHVSIHPAVYAPVGLSLMFLTISSTFWLFVICFDMTLVITRFRWAPPGDASRKQEARKFFVYAVWVWGGTLVPTLFACIVEFSLPKDSPIRPKFDTLTDGPNVQMIVYVAAVPALTCIVNSVLFFYTTYRMIVMQRATTIATQSSTRNAKKKYFIYLKLYLLMDTPWVSGALGAIFPDLWILKFWRMSQPILMLLVILPRKAFCSALTCKGRKKGANEAAAPGQEPETTENKRRFMFCC